MLLKIFFNVFIVFSRKLLLSLNNETQAQYEIWSAVAIAVFIGRFPSSWFTIEWKSLPGHMMMR